MYDMQYTYIQMKLTTMFTFMNFTSFLQQLHMNNSHYYYYSFKEITARTLSHKLYVTDTLISRLGLERELDGHRGCVNCLEWNESGR